MTLSVTFNPASLYQVTNLYNYNAIYIVIDNQNGDDDITALLERQQVTHNSHNL